MPWYPIENKHTLVITAMDAGYITQTGPNTVLIVVRGVQRSQVDLRDRIGYYEQTVPRWILLPCGHVASTLEIFKQHIELFDNNGGRRMLVSARCSLCNNVIFQSVQGEIVDANGLSNFIAGITRRETWRPTC
jgi:hypothetical protein